MKKLAFIKRSNGSHWVGDGFPVKNIFSYSDIAEEMSPFLLMDYAGPADFPPTTRQLGVGQCQQLATTHQRGVDARRVAVGRRGAHHAPEQVAESHGEAAGTVLATKPLTVACGEGAIQLLHVVPEGKKPMDGTSFAAGLRLKAGDSL